jgi:uncharacterized protein YggT (Ycf19 family)
LIYYILDILEVFLSFRLVFKGLGANPSAPFSRFVYGATDPLVAPFRFVFPAVSVPGAVLEWSTVLAMVVYALLAYGIVKLIAIGSR